MSARFATICGGGGTWRRSALALFAGIFVVAACTRQPDPSVTPYPTPYPQAPSEAARDVVDAWVAAWSAGDYRRMWELVAPSDRAVHDYASFEELHLQLAELLGVGAIEAQLDDPAPAALPPEPRPPDLREVEPAAPSPDGSPGASPLDATPGASPAGDPVSPPDPDAVVEGPVPALAVRASVALQTERMGELSLVRRYLLTHGADGWQLRWSPEVLFPQLSADSSLALERSLGRRGRIVARDGTVFAQTRDDGNRVYPQEWLAGQLVGYVTEVTAEDLETLAEEGYRAGDVVGRSGLEAGGEELLRGTPGYALVAVAADGSRRTIFEHRSVPGADLTITIRPDLQRTAEAAMTRYPNVGSAAVDPRNGDIWVLASLPRFNPNAMTIGSTLGGQPLAPPGLPQIRNKALLGAYPMGSTFKVFALAAALREGVVSTSTRMPCPPTWPYSGFTFRNFMNHTLPGLVSFEESMAFSCNTTYMPLSIMVYEHDQRALTDVVRQFGFGARTGVRLVADAPGQLPDHEYYEETPRWDGQMRPYGPFDQIQLAIGQGEFLGTPLQLANAYAAIGNGGTLWRPRLVERVTLPGGRVLAEFEPEPLRQVDVAPEHLAYIVRTMEAVVNYSYGTARAAFVGFGIQVAGKSGTAETGGPDPHAWFGGIVPSTDPSISVATVVVTVPLGTGGDFAAPIVRQIMAAHVF